MNKTYEFNGKKYRLRELDLDLLHRASPMLIRYRELIYKYTCNIDTTKLDAAEYELAELRKALKECGTDNSKLLNKLKTKIDEAGRILNTGENAKLRKYVSDTEALALFEVITDAEFLSGILNDILILEESNDLPGITSKELRDKNSLGFIKQVIADFFLLTQMNS